VAIYSDFAVPGGAGCQPASKGVEKRGFAAPRGPHDGEHVFWMAIASDAFEDEAFACPCCP
jgi:hypothetical protein